MGKILFISKNGDAYGLAMQLADDGHEVFVYIKEPEAQMTGKRCKNPLTVDSWTQNLKGVDFVFFDMVGLGEIADRIKRAGIKVIGSSAYGDEAELERDIGQKLMEKYTDALIPESKTFISKSIEEGIAYVESLDYPVVFKPLGNQFTSWTFVAKEDNNGLVSFMRSLRKKVDYVIQQKVSGVEISTEMWFDG